MPSGYSGLNAQVKQEAQSDPRMYQIYISMLNEWNKYVGTSNLFMDFDLSGPYTDAEYFGALQYVTDPGSQKYDAILSEIYQPGDANLDGDVNYADFQTLEQNYGLSNAWWENGDFNDDGVVNWSDLNLLRTNLDPTTMTLAQFAQIALFGQPSVLTAGQASEYDGYGVTDVSQMPFVSSSNGQGSVRLNTTSSGVPISLGGITYSSGLGVYADSSVTVNLAGQYSVFQSQIGVPSAFSSSSVIFQVYGDGNLLYQSPAVTSASGAIPVDVNVSGVQQLSLKVIGSTGSTTGDSAVWAAPRLISTSNFSEKQVTPYTLTWQVSENGTILSTQTSDSLAFTYPGSGVYTIELTVTDANGDTASSSDTVTVNPVTATATLIGHNTTTQGTWIGTYGSQGYDVVGNTASLPSYATVTPSGESTLTWAVSTTNESALENAGGITGRVAAAWSSATSFSVDVNLTDGNAHDLALYAVDFDNQGISEQIQISAAATGTVLDSESISSFSGGIYLDWRVSGNVLITVTSTSGPAVLSGLFLDAPPVTATLVRQDATTNGDWIGTYGSQGYDIIGTPASIPSYATITLTNQTTDMDDTGAIANAALEQPSGGGRYVGDWSSTSRFSVLVNLTDGQPYDLTLYAVDWADDGRSELIQITNPATGSMLSVKTLSNFQAGAYLQYLVTGSVLITVTRLAGPTAVLNGLFFDSASSPQTSVQTSTATLVQEDSTTQGDWIGTYGSDGYNIIGDATSYPSLCPGLIRRRTVGVNLGYQHDQPAGSAKCQRRRPASIQLGFERKLRDGRGSDRWGAHDVGSCTRSSPWAIRCCKRTDSGH